MENMNWIQALREMERELIDRVVVEILQLGRQQYGTFSVSQIAEEMEVDEKTIRKWRNGEVEPGLRKGLKLLALRDALRSQVLNAPAKAVVAR